MPMFSHSKKEDRPSGADGAEEDDHHHGGCLAGISKSAHHAVEVAHHAVESMTKHDTMQTTFWASEGGGGSGDKTKSVQNMGALYASEAGGSKGKGGVSI
jgi:hypothetical protein